MTIYTKQDKNHPGVTLVALVDSQGREKAWCAVDLRQRKVLARQSGISTVDALVRIGYRRVG